ncbi:uncharacterized protein [Rhodnius prolixus]|uniref:Uncharacterized protein n=1 Tax=Rhodnius prolixus TaxID=13249 RepID=T1HRG3_RHOPR
MVENLENNLEDGDSEVSIEDAKFNKKDLGSLELRQYYEIVYNILTTKTLLCFAFIKNLFTSNFKTNSEDMSRRQKRPDPLGPVSLMKAVRDQIQTFQEKRGISPDENNFLNLLAVVLQQSGNAMYAVFTMFMALLPVGNIIIHTMHFMLERLIDIMTTKKRKDLWVKGSIFILQTICIYLIIHFVMAAIFVPIFAMQTTIVSKILFMEDTSASVHCKK